VSAIQSGVKTLLDRISAKPRKLLFFGPSGCGKTLFVNAINSEAHKADPTWTCVKIESAKMLHGDVCANVKKAFKGIERFRINQIIIDDLEVFLSDLESDPKALRYALNEIRELHDVLLTATTKRPSHLKPEILDMFDEYFPILYPNRGDRRDILRIYYSNFKPLSTADNILLDDLSSRTEWFSGFELAKLIHDTFSKPPPIKKEDFLLNLHQLAASFNIENRHRELEEHLDFILGNSKIPFVFQEHARQVGIELGLIYEEKILELLKRPEDQHLEFKSTLRFERDCLKTICAFLNADGGILIIGVSDDRKVLGLSNDYRTLKKENRDGFENHLINLISSRFGNEFLKFIEVYFESVDDKDICRIKVHRSNKPAYLKEGMAQEFYVRTGNNSRPFSMSEAVEYTKEHWK